MAPKIEGPLIATIKEETRFSFGGVIALIFLIIFLLIGTFGFVAGARTILQEITFALVLICGILLGGIGMIIGRRRTYFVHRELPPDA